MYQPPPPNIVFLGLDTIGKVGAFFNFTKGSPLSDLITNVDTFCELSWSEVSDLYGSVVLDGMTLYNACFEGIYAYQLLTYGFGFAPDSLRIEPTGELYGIEVSWTLGAAVFEVSPSGKSRKLSVQNLLRALF